MNLKAYCFLLLFFLFISGISHTQEKASDFPVLTGPYLGQKPPGMIPEVFAPGILSNANSFCSVFSPDGNEVFFVKDYDSNHSDDIMRMRRVNDIWTEPEPAPFNSIHSDNDICISPDGYRIFWRSWRPLPGSDTPEESSCIWFAVKIKNGWSDPQPVECGNIPVRAGYPAISNNGTLYFRRYDEGNVGKGDIHRSLFVNGSYSTTENLGSTINTVYPEGDMCVAPDESFLIVSCWDRPDNNGDSDLYISFRDKNGSWSALKNMGEPINGRGFENCPMISPDGKYFFFFRPDPDIRVALTFWVDAKIIEKYRPEKDNNQEEEEPFPVLTGPYLGQKPPGMTPEIFAPGIITTDNFEGTSGFLSENNVFVFNRLDKGVSEFTYIPIYVTEVKDGYWIKPYPAPFQNKYNDDNFTVAPDSKTLYFQSRRPTDGTEDWSQSSNIWKSTISTDGWSEPEFVKTIDNKPLMGGYPSITRDGTLYFMGPTGKGFGEIDLFRSRSVNGKYAEPENLGEVVNSEHIEWDSYVAPDESYLIFASDRPGGIANYDLYITFRNDDDVWTEPINMGEDINSADDTSRPSVTPDGKYLFFCKHPEGRDDIYWVDAKIIEGLKPESLK